MLAMFHVCAFGEIGGPTSIYMEYSLYGLFLSVAPSPVAV